MGKSSKLSLALVGLILGGSLVGCSDGRAGAQDAAKQLASAVAALDVAAVPFEGKDSGAANEQLKEVFKALDPAKPSVVTGELKLDKDTATIPLDYSWKIGTGEWKYTTFAQLKKSGDKWLTVWNPASLVPELADGEVLGTMSQSPARADILGAGDAKLVTYRPVVNVGIDKPRLGTADPAASATRLAQLVGVDPAAYSQQVAAAGAEAFVPAITLRQDGQSITDDQIAAIPGARAIADSLPLAPTRTFARALLGTVAEANAEQIEKSGGALKAGDTTGTGGLQQQYDAQLRGTDGIQVFAEKAGLSAEERQGLLNGGRRGLFQVEITPGTALKTTLDPALQQLAEDVLGKVAPASAIVALRPSSGAVLAAASGPGSNGYDTAMLGQYAPGSIFKIVDSLAMIRNGITPDSIVECPATLSVDGRTFKNAEGYPAASLGSVTLRDAFAHSCNTAFINARDTVSQAQQESAATSLGVAVEAPGLGAAAFLGSVPGTAEGTEHAASMIGQGKVLMSPLSAAIMAGSVAKGAPVTPQLVLNPNAGDDSTRAGATAEPTTTSAGPASSAPAPAKTAGTPVTAAEAALLSDMMRAVVTSGHAGFLASVPGAPVGAKTGTAEFGKDDPPKTHAWIVAVHGDLAVAVFVEDGGLGATTSGPLLKEFLTAAG
ncbi:penicillin-binding transpeptidase domain-containing protein [Arthrobacter sp. AL08]|uniref:penicillin-binding transpeptidase domain-containing protein n=1 Tax=Micrococcaceae TaxID=1268 RepID=UPI00249A9D2D|nr:MULTISPECIES: penicillin-binding transpeptidase domain-containing protein [Micrococcaceae]MDI3242050.1 penicillin-binding transpeptidase domain-containing protein [Arthrobacter sp. AL05]MDI3278010.1 penicillin-binding transpeptidase domain-containing protein [Arthrobacter sp. AL08]MDJ0352524.1 penicillin-binding transpeptidase domain-containing protein [Pseudarthrobacter sp. PH31-O2]